MRQGRNLGREASFSSWQLWYLVAKFFNTAGVKTFSVECDTSAVKAKALPWCQITQCPDGELAVTHGVTIFNQIGPDLSVNEAGDRLSMD